jgi:hypothetical protein
VQILTGKRRSCRLALEGSDHAPRRVHLDVPDALRSLERMLVLALEPLLPDHHPLLVVGEGGAFELAL